MTDASSCLCQNVTRSWRDKPEPPFPLNIYEVPETSACLAQESWPVPCKCPAQGWPWRPPPRAQPLLSMGDLHFTSLCALFPLGTHVARVCTPRLHCLVVCWMEPRARGGPESLTRRQLPGPKHPLPSPVLGRSQGLVCLFVCLFVYVKPLPGSF